jgi:hypothetical protein
VTAADERSERSAAPVRNFTLSLAERIRGMAGPPAWSVRLRRIEDLEAKIAELVRALSNEELARDTLPKRLEAMRLSLNELIEKHDAYYPIEANLPRQFPTGAVMDRGEPWKPRGPRSAASFLEAERASRR